jgi:hypothetical protein
MLQAMHAPSFVPSEPVFSMKKISHTHTQINNTQKYTTRPPFSSDDPRIEWVKADISKLDDVVKACKGIDCVFHIAALVGPFHPKNMYMKINYEGTANLIEACKRNGVSTLNTPQNKQNSHNIYHALPPAAPVPYFFILFFGTCFVRNVLPTLDAQHITMLMEPWRCR